MSNPVIILNRGINYHSLELARQAPDRFWLTHEKLLKGLAGVAVARERSHS